MFCDRCGAKLQENQSFCGGCGKAVRIVPFMPVQSRLGGHIRLLGILWLANAAMHLIPGLVLGSIFRYGGFLPPDVPPFVPGLLRTIGGLFLIGGIVGLIAGWGLLARQPWARMLAIVLGCFNLIHVPFGTALGIYTLWVLLPAQSELEYRKMARVA